MSTFSFSELDVWYGSKFFRKSEQGDSPRGTGVVQGRLSRGCWRKLKMIRSKMKKISFRECQTMLKADGTLP